MKSRMEYAMWSAFSSGQLCAMRPLVWTAIAVSLAIGRVDAQNSASSHIQPATSSRISTSVIDTGIQPGHLDYTRYDTPGACVQAVGATRNLAERTRLDTALYAPERDTLPTAAVETARACGARFTLTNTPQREWFNLARLSLMAGDDDKAKAALDRWLAAHNDTNSTSLAWTMLDVMTLYLEARPMRFGPAEAIVAQLDTFGRAAVLPRMIGRYALYNLAAQRFDIPLIERHGSTLLSLDASLSRDEREHLGGQLWQYTVAPGGAGSATILFDLGVVAGYKDPIHAADQLLNVVRQTGFNAVSRDSLPGLMQFMTRQTIPTKVPALPATYWFGDRGNRTFPVPGKVSLFLFSSGNGMYYRLYAMIRRLKEKYGDALNITLVVQTEGYFQDSPPLDPDAEAEALREYFLEYLKLPVTLAVNETPFHRLPDGRRVNDGAEFQKTVEYQDRLSGGFWGSGIIDQRGTSLIFGYPWAGEAVNYLFISRALGGAATP